MVFVGVGKARGAVNGTGKASTLSSKRAQVSFQSMRDP